MIAAATALRAAILANLSGFGGDFTLTSLSA
jgi:hypothetical protein